jgi:hypothetical protein
MRLKLMTLFLGITTIILGITTYIYYLKAQIQTELLADRELTITNYKKVINAIGKTGGISIDKLKTELKTEFSVDEKIGFYDHDKEYYYVLNPKTNDINYREIWEFMGLELILDEQKKFKTVKLHKP